MNAKIIVVGSLNMDLVVQVQELPKEGETLLGIAMSENPGGKGANQAVAIGKLQASVSMIGRVGKDAHGARLLDSLQQAGVDTQYLMESTTPTGIALVTVDGHGSNHIIVVPGANFELAVADIEQQRAAIEQCEIVVLQLEVPMATVVYTLKLAKELGKTTILNPAPAQPLSKELLQYVDLLVPNEHELQSLSGIEVIDEASLKQAAIALLGQGVQALLVTLGAAGCCYIDHDGFTMYPTAKVQAVDTTAAGDSFIGGFVAGYVQHHDMAAAIAQAQKAAAITVTRHGAQVSLPTWNELSNA
ncbi:ribokinase [Paenibacillus agricola]|uniref:Ribokinase n=1 Tax=Paenibacillus agricola TaxID=2716264 RepID=A0ABX0JCV0_9BACL|nr:ribokinase [Paenibacillus agricola]NHN33076.1 ribokinase [Paenibacillus agricola]